MAEAAVAILKENEDMMIMIAVFCPCCNEKYPDEWKQPRGKLRGVGGIFMAIGFMVIEWVIQ